MMKLEMMRHRTLTAAVLMTTAVLTTVLVAACGNEEDKAIDTETAITLNVSEEPWETDAVTLTRGGEATLAQLKSSGFGLYCEQLEMENKQVTWDASNNRWNFGNGNKLVWPNDNNNTATAYAYAPYSSTPDFSSNTILFTFTTPYESVSATFTSPINTSTTWDADTRTFTWSASTYNQLHKIGLPSGNISKYKRLVVDCDIISGEKFRILFYHGDDNLTLWVTHSGISVFDIEKELKALDATNYSNYINNCTEIRPSGSSESSSGEVILRNIYLETDGSTDLLYASGTVTNKGALNLNFQHALAKLSVGTITNSYGREVTLKDIVITGTHYTSGKLGLNNGNWSDADADKTSTTAPITRVANLPIADGTTAVNTVTTNFDIDDILLIPGSGGSCPALTVTFTFGIEGEADIVVSKDLTLTQGRHTTINVSIGKNHEVVIKP